MSTHVATDLVIYGSLMTSLIFESHPTPSPARYIPYPDFYNDCFFVFLYTIYAEIFISKHYN